MIRVGLTGGLACGKSYVGSLLAGMGCRVIRADDLGHAVLAPGGEAFEPVVRHFGTGILGTDGTIDRRKLGAIVFRDAEQLALLNSIVHPAVFRLEDEFAQAAAAADPDAIVVVEAAILIETGSHRRYDRLIVVVCSEAQQIERAMHRDGSSREDVETRLRRQMPLHEKRKYADYVIDTSGSKEETAGQTRLVYEALRSKVI
jgi:dephospho-CoA kinase